MKWSPELQPREGATDRTIMEWLVRSFRKISHWSDNVVIEGYGGLYLSAPITFTPAITLTTTFQKLTGFDTEMTGPAVRVDVANSRMAVAEAGRWIFEFAAVGEIVPFATNAAQTIEVAAYNETKAISHIVGYHPVPRYSEVFDVSLTGQRPIPFPTGIGTDPGDWMSLWIRQRSATPAITVNTAQELEISAFRVGNA